MYQMSHILHRIVKNILRTIDHKKAFSTRLFSPTRFFRKCVVSSSLKQTFSKLTALPTIFLAEHFKLFSFLELSAGFFKVLISYTPGSFPDPWSEGLSCASSPADDSLTPSMEAPPLKPCSMGS